MCRAIARVAGREAARRPTCRSCSRESPRPWGGAAPCGLDTVFHFYTLGGVQKFAQSRVFCESKLLCGLSAVLCARLRRCVECLSASFDSLPKVTVSTPRWLPEGLDYPDVQPSSSPAPSSPFLCSPVLIYLLCLWVLSSPGACPFHFPFLSLQPSASSPRASSR